jgi:cysteine desulfurase
VNDSRGKIAVSLGAHNDEIIFTSGGTESDNLALLGVLEQSKKIFSKDTKPHIIISAIEHAAVYETALNLEKEGRVTLSLVPVDDQGLLDLDVFKKELRKETIFVSVMQANNEIGTIQPIKEIAKIIRHFKKSENSFSTDYPVFHTDACQSFVYEHIRVESLGVDMLSINASKIYGPKGIGALYKKRSVEISPIMFGGDQEFRMRPGTENVPLVACFAQAVLVNESLKEKESGRLNVLQKYFFQELKNNFKVQIHGNEDNRLPNNINVSFVGYRAENILLYLDAQGIAVSEKSACKSVLVGMLV